MTAYQSGHAKFDDLNTQIVGVSTDGVWALKAWAKDLNASYLLLSDQMRKVSEQYGILMPQNGMANRATFVIDMDGKIVSVEEGNTAVDPTGAETACSRIKKKAS
jgi:peroxiredoxin